MNDLIVTMDTGGSKTLLNLYDGSGKLLSEARCVGVGVGRDTDAQIDKLLDALGCLMAGRNCTQVSKVVGNVGGANDVQLHEVMSSYFPFAKVEIYRESSGILMKALCDAKSMDVLLMAGTGAIALAVGKKGSVITDGWSPYLGDGGSGFWVGLQALRYSLKALEMSGELPLIVQKITGRREPFTAVNDTRQLMRLRDEVRSRFMPLERKKVADLTRIVAECARTGDEPAIKIFREAGRELAKTALRAILLCECQEPVNVMVTGGLVGCADLWGETFDETLTEEKVKCSWHIGEADMIEGALYHALKNK